jgi:hypothetical protein
VDNHPVNFLIIFALIFFITNKALLKVYFLKIDPLMFVTLHVSLVVSAVLYEAAFIEPLMVLIVLAMHMSFLVGVRLTHSLLPYNNLSKKTRQSFVLDDLSVKNTMFAFCFLYILYGVVIWLNFGLLILSDDPEYYKLQFATGGLGFVSRIATGATLPLFFFVILAWKNCSWLNRIIPVITLMLAVASSGKSVFINLIIVGLIASIYKAKVLGIRTHQSYARLISLALLALGFVLFVLYLAYGDAVTTDGQWVVLSLLLERISTAPGLGLTAYLQNMSYFDEILKGDFFAYLWNYLVVPVAAPLRLVEYVPTAGREIGIYLSGAEDYGPNPTLYAEGVIYFGPLFGWIYAFGIGCLISILRYLAVAFGILFSPIFGALAFMYLYSAMLAISTDFLVFMALATSYLFFMLVFYLSSIFQKVVKVSLK